MVDACDAPMVSEPDELEESEVDGCVLGAVAEPEPEDGLNTGLAVWLWVVVFGLILSTASILGTALNRSIPIIKSIPKINEAALRA